MKTFVLHRTYERSVEDHKGSTVFFVHCDGKTKKLPGKTAISKFYAGLKKGDTVRLTAVGSMEKDVLAMQKAGVTVVSAHWHATGVEKNLQPEQLVEQFATVSADVFKEVKLREDLLELKARVNARFAVMDLRKIVEQRLMQAQRTLGFEDNDDDIPKWLLDEKAEAGEVTKDAEKKTDKTLLEAARKIPEYVILSGILGTQKDGFSAAGIAAYVGDPQRFKTVSALWHYAGHHVIDGKAPRRKTGQVQTWNTKLKTVLWTTVDSLVKNNPVWKPRYQEFAAVELAVHAEKHPDCKNPEVHSKARARRKIAKEILKQYFFSTREQVCGVPSHVKGENQMVAAKRTAKKSKKAALKKAA